MEKEIIKQQSLINIEEVAEIIHKGIYGEELSEKNSIRNLYIYGIASAICDRQAELMELKK